MPANAHKKLMTRIAINHRRSSLLPPPLRGTARRVCDKQKWVGGVSRWLWTTTTLTVSHHGGGNSSGPRPFEFGGSEGEFA